jgi:cob(I)alamin adenosyltransferase
MLYTRKGDKGDTSAFGCKQRFSKNSALTEALGSLDELNSLLGICKIKARDLRFKIYDLSLFEIIEQVQQNLFIIQANIAGLSAKASAKAGADKKITQKKINDLEKIIDNIEKELMPIKSFFLPGGTELSAYLDYARAIIRRTERRVIALSETQKINDEILAYLNRLSSLFYALARLVNSKSGAKEIPPKYD